MKLKGRIVATLIAFALGLAACQQAQVREQPAEIVGPQAVSGPFVVEPLDITLEKVPAPYAYSQLDAENQERYRVLLDIFQTREARDYPDDDMERLTRIRDCVLSDHPELFDVSSVHMETTSNSLTGEVTHVSVEGRYAHSAEEANAIVEQASRAAESCFAALPAGADDYEKAKCAYEWLANHVAYDEEAAGQRAAIGEADASEGASVSPDQTIEGALVAGRAVCGGYASAYVYLLQRAGVQCAYVSGYADGGQHAWCLAELDGDYYFIDPTWGDPRGADEGYVDYGYLAVTSADLAEDHESTSSFPLPECTARDDCYFVREGKMFDWADEARLAELVSADTPVQVRCSNAEAYYALRDDVVTSGRLAELLPVNAYRYSYSDELMTLSVL